MNLDPSVSPWINIVASTGVCLWMAAIGLPLSYTVFGDRPRLVWPFYAPALGIVVVLLTTNLSAYLIPGAPSAWFGLLAPSAIAAVVAWRDREICLPSPCRALTLLTISASSIGVFVFALANRAQKPLLDEAWHFALAKLIANGVFPPTTPYGPSAGIGYHYGHNLLAAVIVNVAGAPAWTSLFVLVSFLVVVLILVSAGFARDLGASPPLALGVGAAIGLYNGSVHMGLPAYVEPGTPTGGLTGLLAGLSSAEPGLAFAWLQVPQQALAIAIVVLVAAALEAGARRRWAVIAAAAGVAALADASVMIFSSAALGAVGAVHLLKSRGTERFALAAALVAVLLLITLAGGPISDELFGRGGTAGLTRFEFSAQPRDLLPAKAAGPASVRISVISLIAVGAFAAFKRRSWGLGFLSFAAAFGLIEAWTIHSSLSFNDVRISRLATVVAMLAALSGSMKLISRFGAVRRALVALAIALLILLPSSLQNAVAGIQFASRGFGAQRYGPDLQFVGELNMGSELAANWYFYDWLDEHLPDDTRLLTTHPGLSASVAGIVSPTSGEDLQMLSANILPVYVDALRFLHRDDLAAMNISHLHVTDSLEEALVPESRRLLDNPSHFELLAEIHSVSGRRHRVFEVVSGAGTRDVNPSSYRYLRSIVPPDAPIVLLGRLSTYQRRMILYTFADRDDLWRTDFVPLDRSTHIPRANELSSDIPESSVLILTDRMEPTLLGLSRDDAIWAGDGMRAYVRSRSWSRVWRLPRVVTPDRTPDRSGCVGKSDELVDVRLLGEPGTRVSSGDAGLDLTGVPQLTRVASLTCREFVLDGFDGVEPFAQSRPSLPHLGSRISPSVAGLGFDGHIENGRSIINLWYRNTNAIPFETGTEFRLYEADRTGLVLLQQSPLKSIRWWSGPIVLSAESQMAQIEFERSGLRIEGKYGAGGTTELKTGRTYLLVLGIAGADPGTSYADVLQIVPLVSLSVGEADVSYEMLSGIVAIEHRKPGAQSRRLPSWGSISNDVDFTPSLGLTEYYDFGQS